MTCLNIGKRTLACQAPCQETAQWRLNSIPWSPSSSRALRPRSDLVSKFAAENPKYRAALIADAKGTIERQLNAAMGSTKVVAVADTADTYHIVVPYVAAEGELSDSDLEKVAGGLADKTANCNESPGAMNTFIQLNL